MHELFFLILLEYLVVQRLMILVHMLTVCVTLLPVWAFCVSICWACCFSHLSSSFRFIVRSCMALKYSVKDSLSTLDPEFEDSNKISPGWNVRTYALRRASIVLQTGRNRELKVGSSLYVFPFSVSWLVWSEVGGLWAAGTVVGASVVRRAHIS